MEKEPNIAAIYFLGPEKFARESDSIQISQNTVLEIDLLPQATPEAAIIIEELADATVNTHVAIVALLLSNKLVIASIFSQIRSLSVITHMMLVSVQIPSTVMIFYSRIFEIVKFDVLEELFRIDLLIDYLFRFEREQERGDVQQLGYESPYLVRNIGTVFIAFIFITTQHLFFTFLIKC